MIILKKQQQQKKGVAHETWPPWLVFSSTGSWQEGYGFEPHQKHGFFGLPPALTHIWAQWEDWDHTVQHFHRCHFVSIAQINTAGVLFLGLDRHHTYHVKEACSTDLSCSLKPCWSFIALSSNPIQLCCL